jgi:Negative regulator of beta-lactamase expression
LGGSILPFSVLAPPEVKWVGAHSNNYGGTIDPRVICLHTMAGTLGSCDSWFNNPAAVVSAHYGVGFDGSIHQYVKLNQRAYANGILEANNRWPYPQNINPNYLTVSIETEGTSEPVTVEMFNSVQWIVNFVKRQYNIELITSHHVISPSTRPNCCGVRWRSLINQLGVPSLW